MYVWCVYTRLYGLPLKFSIYVCINNRNVGSVTVLKSVHVTVQSQMGNHPKSLLPPFKMRCEKKPYFNKQGADHSCLSIS